MSQHTGYYRCFYKAVRTTRRGDPMLAARLVDATSQIGAIAFDNVGDLAGNFEPGDVVRAAGSLGAYDGKPQLRLRAIEQVAAAPAHLIVPGPKRDLDELFGFAQHFAGLVTDQPFSRLLFALFQDAWLARAWKTSPATTFSHHAYVGGLLEHSVAVATIADELCTLHPSLSRDLLLTASLVHDLGRTHIYPRDDRWTSDDRDPIKATIEIVGAAAQRTRLPARHWLAFAGAIAFGAGRTNHDEGRTPEATALRCADMLDSNVAEMKRRVTPAAAIERAVGRHRCAA